MKPDEVRLVFMGSPGFAVPSLRRLADAGYQIVGVFTQPDRPAGRGRKLEPPAVKLAAVELGLTIFQPPRLRDAEATATLRSLAPDLILVAAYGQILRPAVLDLPRLGCLNVHASLLPRHRGASAIAASILAGDAETGVSIMQIDRGMDTGPVLAQRAAPVEPADTTGSLAERLAHLGAELLVEATPAWLAGDVTPQPQDESRATLAPLLAKEAGLIDWSKPALRLWREVRAYNPWPLSATTLGGETLQVLEALPLPESSPEEATAAGTVVPLPSGAAEVLGAGVRRAAFAVVTGQGLLVPLVVRRAGRGAVSAADFARGVRGLIGARLG